MVVGIDRVESSAPIGHHDALVMPGIAKRRFQQIVRIGAMHPVDQVVTGHEAPRVALLDGDFERLQIDFVEGALVDDRIADVPIGSPANYRRNASRTRRRSRSARRE